VVEENKLNFSLLDQCCFKIKKFKRCKRILNYPLDMSQMLRHYLTIQQRIALRHLVSQFPALPIQEVSHLYFNSDTKYHK